MERMQVESVIMTMTNTDPMTLLRNVYDMLEEGRIDRFEIRECAGSYRADIVLVEPVKAVMYSMELKP